MKWRVSKGKRLTPICSGRPLPRWMTEKSRDLPFPWTRTCTRHETERKNETLSGRERPGVKWVDKFLKTPDLFETPNQIPSTVSFSVHSVVPGSQPKERYSVRDTNHEMYVLAKL